MFERFKAARKLKEMEERLENVERGFKKIALEWEDSYDRFRAVVQRIVKRAEAVEKLTAEAEGEAEPDASLPPGLSPSQREKQQQILARRSRLGRPQ